MKIVKFTVATYLFLAGVYALAFFIDYVGAMINETWGDYLLFFLMTPPMIIGFFAWVEHKSNQP